MDLINASMTQIQDLWGRWSASQRIGIVAALIASAGAIIGVGVWASSPEYVFIAERLPPQQAAEIVSTLDAANIRYRLNYAGSTVLVSKTDVNRARLALKDVLLTGDQPESTITEGIWSDPTLHSARLNRQLETRLARSITQISSVKTATVLLSAGESTPFLREKAAAKASVILELHPSSMFSANDARAIASLVSHSVEKLSPENVSILDTNGRLLSTTSGLEGDVTGQPSYRGRVEADLSAKAEAILTQMLGPGRAIVRVTADVDFTQTQTKETRFDPELKVKVSETIHSESSTSAPRQAGGPAGATPNLNALVFKTSGSSGGSKSESNTTTYENARTEDIVNRVPGKIARLTVAAVVQLPDEATAGTVAFPMITREQIQNIIKQAVGFDANRFDEIEVLTAPLVGNLDLLPTVDIVPWWEQYLPLIKNLSLGIASVVSLLLGFLVIRRMQPIVLETESKESLPPELVLKIADQTRQALDDPELVAKVIHSWMEDAVEQKVRIAA